MVDFPASPANGRIHQENGGVWRYRSPPGAWELVMSGAPLAMIEANAAAGWQIWGDVLLQWGQATTNGSGQASVVFAEEFADTAYAVTATAANVATSSYNVGTTNPATTGFDVLATDMADVGVATDVDWIAVGEAPDDMKKPKETSTAGGGALDGSVILLDEGIFIDSTDRETSSDVLYAASCAGPDINVKSLGSGEFLVGTISSRVQCENRDGTSSVFNSNIGYSAACHWFDGIAYQTLPSGLSAPVQQLLTRQEASLLMTARWYHTLPFWIDETMLRSDVPAGQWSIRQQFSALYDPGKATVFESQYSWRHYRRIAP